MPVRNLSEVLPPAGAPVAMGLLPAFHAARTPAAPAVTFGAETIDYAELEARANRRARRLASVGVGQDDIVILAAPKSLAFYEWSFAIWKLGASVCHVSAALPAAELDAILTLAAPRAVIALSPPPSGQGVFVPALEPVNGTLSATSLPERIARNWKVSTSGGSTGRPKLIVDQGRAVWNPGQTMLGLKAGDVVVNPAPLYHTAPFGFMHNVLFTGGHVIELPRFDPEELLEAVAKWRGTWLYLVPTMMHRIWRLPSEVRTAYDVSSLQVLIHMAAACPIWLKQAWIDWLGPEVVWELYGGTEVLGATLINGEEWLTHRGSVGRLWMGSGMKVFAEDGSVCAHGEIGEVYFHVGEKTPYQYIGAEARVRGDWQSFGDMGSMDAEGYLYLADKRTDLIVSGGANVYPAEVEAAIESHPDVECSVVIGLPDDDFGHRVHAIIQSKAAAIREVEPLKAYLRERLSGYKIPKSFEFVSEPLRSEDGKVRRSALRAARIMTPTPS